MGVSNEAVQAVERMLTTLRAERDDYRELTHHVYRAGAKTVRTKAIMHLVRLSNIIPV